jgi:hypothetical protein
MTKQDIIKTEMLNAALAEMSAREAKAKATIRLYLNNPVAISDHSELVDEIIKWANYGVEAADAKKYLSDNFLITDEEP